MGSPATPPPPNGRIATPSVFWRRGEGKTHGRAHGSGSQSPTMRAVIPCVFIYIHVMCIPPTFLLFSTIIFFGELNTSVVLDRMGQIEVGFLCFQDISGFTISTHTPPHQSWEPFLCNFNVFFHGLPPLHFIWIEIVFKNSDNLLLKIRMYFFAWSGFFWRPSLTLGFCFPL